VVAGADLVLLALPDDALEGMVRGLGGHRLDQARPDVVHTSGAHGVDVLERRPRSARCPRLHPVMTFTGRAEDLERIVACCFGVTATDGDETAWKCR